MLESSLPDIHVCNVRDCGWETFWKTEELRR